MTGQKIPLQPFALDVQDFDILFIGTPVWAFSFTPALRTFFARTPLRNKKIALFCCHGGMYGATFTNMKKALCENTIAGEIDFLEPKERASEACAQKAREWAKGIVEACQK